MTFGDQRLPPRFWRKVVVAESGCWEWKASGNQFGYGRLRVGRRMIVSHRVSYEALVGPIPDGLELDHICRNRPCVNPAHLEPVTRIENVRRSDAGRALAEWQLAKTHCPRGHLYDERNTYVGRNPNGRPTRVCRACGREKKRARKARSA